MKNIRSVAAPALCGIVLAIVSNAVRPPTAGAATAASKSSSRAVVQRHFKAFETAIAQATTKAQASTYVTDAQDRADAKNYVRQLAQLNLETQLLAVDPNHPVFVRDPDPFSVPGDNPPARSGIYDPDNLSYIAIVDGTGQYRITGKRGNSDDLSVQAISGFPGAGSTGNPTATLLKTQIAVNADGTYTINVGGSAQSGNWLPMVPQTTLISIREAFNNWPGAVADQVRIQRVGQSANPAAKLTSQQLVAPLTRRPGP